MALAVVSPFSVATLDSPASVKRGQKLRWRFSIANDTEDYRDVEVWFDAYLIGGGAYPRNPLDGPYSGTLSPYFLAEFPNSVLIPPNAPLGGAYRICTRAGIAPDEIWTEDCFEFSVAP